MIKNEESKGTSSFSTYSAVNYVIAPNPVKIVIAIKVPTLIIDTLP